MRGLFNTDDKNMVISISAIDYIDFKAVDSRIQHDGMWLESYPMQTKITLPKDCSEEIIAKLKLQDYITTVNDEWTTVGMGINARRELRQ